MGHALGLGPDTDKSFQPVPEQEAAEKVGMVFTVSLQIKVSNMKYLLPHMVSTLNI